MNTIKILFLSTCILFSFNHMGYAIAAHSQGHASTSHVSVTGTHAPLVHNKNVVTQLHPSEPPILIDDPIITIHTPIPAKAPIQSSVKLHVSTDNSAFQKLYPCSRSFWHPEKCDESK